jgi:hypothetical protein
MNRWNDIRRLATIIEAEAEGRLIDRELAVSLARQLAEHHPQIQASMALVVQRMSAAGRSTPACHDDEDDADDFPGFVPGAVSTSKSAAVR